MSKKTKSPESQTSEITPHANGGGNVLDVGEFEHHEILALGVVFRPGIPESEWLEITQRSIAMYEGSRDLHMRAMFVLGDCLAFGEGNFQERWAQAIDSTRKAIRLSAKSIENAAWIAGSVPIEARHAALSFAHHEVVAKIEDKSEQSKFLDLAEEEELSVSDLRGKVKEKFPSNRSSKKGDVKTKVILDFSDTGDVKKGLEKISEYLTAETVKSLDKDEVKEYAALILTLVELFGISMHAPFFERLAGLTGHYLDESEVLEPIAEWLAKRREAWTPHLERIGKAYRRLDAANKRSEKARVEE